MLICNTPNGVNSTADIEKLRSTLAQCNPSDWLIRLQYVTYDKNKRGKIVHVSVPAVERSSCHDRAVST